MLTDVRQSKPIMRTVRNGGHQDSRLTGMLPGFFCAWLNPELLLNKLAMKDVTNYFRVTMDSSTDDAIIVHFDARRIIRFEKIGSDLYMLSRTK